MWIYIVLPIMIGYGLLMQRALLVKASHPAVQHHSLPAKSIQLVGWFLVFLAIAAFKGTSVGTDSQMYYRFFFSDEARPMEPAVRALYELANVVDSYFLFQVSMFILFLFFVFKGIRQHCPNYLIGLLFFVLTYVYYTGFNQMRQIVAAALIFCFGHYIVSNKKFRFVCIVVIASLFHQSALFLVALLLLPKGRLSLKIVVPLFSVTILLYFFPEAKNSAGRFFMQLSSFYENKYENQLDYFFLLNKEKGLLQLAPVLFQMILILISYYYPQQNKKLLIDQPFFSFASNIVILNLALYAFAGIEAIDRVQVYLAFFNIYFYAIYVHQLLQDKNQLLSRLYVVGIVSFWILYYGIRLQNNNQGIVPYVFF